MAGETNIASAMADVSEQGEMKADAKAQLEISLSQLKFVGDAMRSARAKGNVPKTHTYEM